MIGIAGSVSGPTRLDIYWREGDSAVHHQPGDGTQWSSDWENLGGTFITVPAVVATRQPQPFSEILDVFAVGKDFALYTKQFDQGAWSPDWLSLEGNFNSGPAVIGRASGRLDVFAVGSDFAMYHCFRVGSPDKGGVRWSPWEYLGGRFSSAAAVVSRDITSIDVFARGADFTLRHRRNTNDVWSDDWQNLGGSLASPPAAVSWGANRMDVFAVGSDGELTHRWWDSEIWNDWESLGGRLTQTPSVVSPATGRLDVFALGLDSGIHHFSFGDHAWNGIESLAVQSPVQFTTGPLALSPEPNHINLVAVGTDHNIYAKFSDGTSWAPEGFDFVGSGKVSLPTRYSFSVDHVHVTVTRSLDSDTDMAVASVGAGNWPVLTATQGTGDIGGLTNPKEAQFTNLAFAPVTVELCETSIFQYLIVNAGNVDTKALDAALTKAVGSITDDLVKTAAKGIGAGVAVMVGLEVLGDTIFIPVAGSLLASLAGWLYDKLGEIVFADCDGIVAAETASNLILGRDLYLATKDGPLSTTTTHQGVDSPDGCGSNSVYEVTWTVSSA
jgi:hypothetical protein